MGVEGLQVGRNATCPLCGRETYQLIDFVSIRGLVFRNGTLPPLGITPRCKESSPETPETIILDKTANWRFLSLLGGMEFIRGDVWS